MSITFDRPLEFLHPAEETKVTAFQAVQLLDSSGVSTDLSGQNIIIRFRGRYTTINLFRGLLQLNESGPITGNSFIDSNVDFGTTYTYSIVPFDVNGISGKAQTISQPTLPILFSLIETNVDISSVTMDCSGLYSYLNILQDGLSLLKNQSGSHFIASDLSYNTSYTFRMIPLNSNYNEGAYLELTSTTLPLFTSLTSSNIDISSVTLNCSGYYSYFNLWKNGSSLVTHGTGGSYQVKDLSYNTSYTFRMIPLNSIYNEGAYLELTSTTLPLFTSLTSSNIDISSVTLNCSGYYSYFNLWKNGSSLVTHGTGGSYQVKDLSYNTSYTFRMIPLNSNYNEGAYLELTSTTLPLFTSLTSSNIDISSVTLNCNGYYSYFNLFKNGSSLVTHGTGSSYQIKDLSYNTSYTFRMIPLNSNYNEGAYLELTSTTLPLFTSLTSSNIDISSVTLNCNGYYSYFNLFKNGSSLVTHGTGGSYQVKDLSYNTSYTFRMIPLNSVYNEGTYLDISSTTLPLITTLSTSNVGINSVTLNFSGFFSYVNIFDACGNSIATNRTGTSYIATGLSSNTYYKFRVVPYNIANDAGAWVDISQVTNSDYTIYSNVSVTPDAAFTSNNVTISGNTGYSTWKNGNYIISDSGGDAGGYGIYNIFRYAKGSDTTAVVRYYTLSGSTNINGSNVTGSWIQIKLPNPFCITKYILEQNAGWNNCLSDWYIVGSDDGTAFTQLDRKTGQDIRGQKNYITVSNTNYYTYYRVVMTAYSFDSAVFTLFQLFGDAKGPQPISDSSSNITNFNMINSGLSRTVYPTNPNNSPYYFAWDANVNHTSYVNSLAFFNNYSISNTITSIVPTINIANTSGGQFAVSNKGYFKPDATGTWTFTFRADDIGVFWIGSTPNQSYSTFYASLTESNYNLAGWFSSGFVSYSVTLSSSVYYPFLLNWAESWGGYRMDFSVTSPSSVNTDGSSYFYHISSPDIFFNCSSASIESVSPYRIKNIVTDAYSSSVVLSAAPSSSIVNVNPGGISGGQAINNINGSYHIEYNLTWSTPTQVTGAGYSFTSWFYSTTQKTGIQNWASGYYGNINFVQQVNMSTLTTGYYQFYLQSAGEWLTIPLTVSLADGTWHFYSVVITCTDGATGAYRATLYLDKGSGLSTELSVTKTYTSGYSNNPTCSSFWFGRRWNNQDSYWPGYSTNFRVYSEPLSSTQLTYMYNNKM